MSIFEVYFFSTFIQVNKNYNVIEVQRLISTDYITLSSNLKTISFLNLSCILPPVKGFTFSLTFNVINAMTMSNWLSIEKVFHKTHKVLANLGFLFFFNQTQFKNQNWLCKKTRSLFAKKKMFHLHAVFLYCNLYFFSPNLVQKMCIYSSR